MLQQRCLIGSCTVDHRLGKLADRMQLVLFQRILQHNPAVHQRSNGKESGGQGRVLPNSSVCHSPCLPAAVAVFGLAGINCHQPLRPDGAIQRNPSSLPTRCKRTYLVLKQTAALFI